MIQTPRNCRTNCPKQNSSDCPAIIFEQQEHMLGFSQLVITVSQVIGCAAYPENTKPAQESTQAPAEKHPAVMKKRK